MNWRHYLVLLLLGLAVAISIASFQSAPGYMDADYYFATGVQLAQGQGFSEPFLWNYLEDPAGLPHPSHAYWMPLASLLASVGMLLSGHSNWLAARAGFILAAALIPPLTAALAYSLIARRDLALISGLLAVFSGYYAVYLPVTDTFGVYMILGGLFFLLLKRQSAASSLFLGVLSGLMHLARADGLLWLLLALLAVIYIKPASRRSLITHHLSQIMLCLAGYLLIMAPWFARNQVTFGAFLAPGGWRALWLTSYDQLFTYPTSQITFQGWLGSGFANILDARLWALGINLENTMAVQGGIFLLPFIVIGFWHLRRDQRLRLAAIAWGLTLAVMTLAFPFAGARGGFFHSGAALQPMWWALAPSGLEVCVDWAARRRGWPVQQARRVFLGGMVALAALLTGILAWGRVIGGSNGEPVWGQRAAAYRQVEQFLAAHGVPRNAVILAANPPGWYAATGRPAIVIPTGDEQAVLAVAERYGGEYPLLILEADNLPDKLQSLYNQPEDQPGFHYRGEVEGIHVYAITP